MLKNTDHALEVFGKIHSLTKRLNEHLTERSTEHLSEHYVQYISITYGIVNEHLSEHLTERYFTNFTTSSRTYLLRPAIPNPRDLSISIKYHL